MKRAEIYALINKFAPPETAEDWDCVGILAENKNEEIKKILLCLTVTDDVFNQAIAQGCDMIISHHPLFYVPIKYKEMNIFCAHTNLDLAQGGTTDTLIEALGLEKSGENGFVRYVNLPSPVLVQEFAQKLKELSPNLRYVNNQRTDKIQKIAFCAGSGSEFIETAKNDGADAFVTGDLKFHTALESPIVIFDIGHFESEIPILKVFETLLQNKAEIIFAKEESPFKTI